MKKSAELGSSLVLLEIPETCIFLKYVGQILLEFFRMFLTTINVQILHERFCFFFTVCPL
jgi:hypothetical protein